MFERCLAIYMWILLQPLEILAALRSLLPQRKTHVLPKEVVQETCVHRHQINGEPCLRPEAKIDLPIPTQLVEAAEKLARWTCPHFGSSNLLSQFTAPQKPLPELWIFAKLFARSEYAFVNLGLPGIDLMPLGEQIEQGLIAPGRTPVPQNRPGNFGAPLLTCFL